MTTSYYNYDTENKKQDLYFPLTIFTGIFEKASYFSNC